MPGLCLQSVKNHQKGGSVNASRATTCCTFRNMGLLGYVTVLNQATLDTCTGELQLAE